MKQVVGHQLLENGTNPLFLLRFLLEIRGYLSSHQKWVGRLHGNYTPLPKENIGRNNCAAKNKGATGLRRQSIGSFSVIR